MPFQLPSFFSQVMSKSATVLFEAFNEASVEIHPEYALKEVFGSLGLVEVINHNQKVAKWVRRLIVEGKTSVNNIVDLLHRDA